MDIANLTPMQQRQRKALLLLPLIVLPFVALLFWALGGGKGTAAKGVSTGGLNVKLPGALLDSTGSDDKLAFYDQAQRDSVAKANQRKNDPYAIKAPDTLLSPTTPASNEAKIYERLKVLQTAVDKAPEAKLPVAAVAPETVQRTVPAEDPELKQMGQLLEKVLDIQHPERLRHQVDSAEKVPLARFRAIPAVIDGQQKIREGTVIRLRLTDSVTLGGQFFPRGQLVFGSGSFYNQRFKLNIRSMRIGYQIHPVDLTVFDQQDGLEGICVPEALTGDALKGGSVRAVEGTQFLSMDASVAAQAATAGINTAKGLFSKKVKAIKAKLPDGRALLLRNNDHLKP